MRRIATLVLAISTALWSVSSLSQLAVDNSFLHHGKLVVTITEVQVLLHGLIFCLASWITIEWLIDQFSRNRTGQFSLPKGSNRARAFLLGALALASHQPTQPSETSATTSENVIPLGFLLTPAMARLLLQDIRKRRREQIRLQRIPDELSLRELELLGEVQDLARRSEQFPSCGEIDSSIPLVRDLTEAVERVEVSKKIDREEPVFVVRVYGYPEVRGRDGQSASFRKKRALELIVWLSLNRDRPRRSAARSALWQFDVSDSSFSTIVSDMRRGISEVSSNICRSELAPTTYSDEIVLNGHVTTDYELLRLALEGFRADPLNYKTLVNEMREIRDAPFAGTAYEWADLDGTTTRLIITAMQAAQELAEYAQSVGDIETLTTAVTAGLRVMPGNEELLEIQKSVLHLL